MLKDHITVPRYPVEHTIWRVVDSHWVCNLAELVSGRTTTPFNTGCRLLCDYLYHLGFDIPDCIDYCLATNLVWRLKFRRFGNSIHLYVTKNTD